MRQLNKPSSPATAGRPVLRNRRAPGGVVWFTGLSGSGKTTLARALAEQLASTNGGALVLDGDELRDGLCRDLGFSARDRDENVRRAAEMARWVADSGRLCLVSLISPHRAARDRARKAIGPARFVEVHVAADLEVCRARDVKGLYRRAQAGKVRALTGISAPYEAPRHPALKLDTADLSLERCVAILIALLHRKRLIRS